MLPLLLLLACSSGSLDKSLAPAPSADDTGAAASSGDGGAEDGGTEDGGSEDGGSEDGGSEDGGTGDGGAEEGPACFEDIASPVDYLSSGAVLNSTCTGTDHQDISGVQRVVFVGDSLTAGAPIPSDYDTWELTDASEWYRNLLADELAARWGLDEPSWAWENVSLTSGESYEQLSGDFANCSKWGARTDDLHKDNSQLEDCLPEDSRDVHNLVIMTIGGNDLYNLLDHIKTGDADEETMRAEWELGITDLEDAITWLTEDPARFPGGLSIVVANIFDVTDEVAANDIADCPGAELIDIQDALRDPLTAELAIEWQERLLALAAETGIDVAFMGETFCGHGYNWDDESGRCYRGGDDAIYFDISCEHPSPDGHAAIYDMMLGVIEE